MQDYKKGFLLRFIRFVSFATFALGIPTLKAQLVRVPGDQPGLQQAIAAVADGGVIELAAGTYTAPSGGFTILDYSKGFTIRAATGAAVTLSGGNSADIIRFANSPGRVPHTIIFDRIKFSNGLTTQFFLGGALTIVRNNVVFTACIFENNKANSTLTGGGAIWFESASASFHQCAFNNNSSQNYGGAISAVTSRVFIRECTFTGNRTDLPNHRTNASGGAIQLSDSVLEVTNSRFENNHAGYVGGAIYCGGKWANPVDSPSTLLTVKDSLFTGNSAHRDPSVAPSSPAIGGAVHLEDQTTGRLIHCRFLNNFALQGGAVSSYRGIAEITGCYFEGNHADGTNMGESIGGSIFALSADVPDGSTDFGNTNRRPAMVTITDSLFRGDGNTKNALQGGAVFVGGDLNSAYGGGGVKQNGTPDSNRAHVIITRTGFAGLVTTAAPGIPASSGALGGTFVNFTMTDSIVENCSTTDVGGAMEFVQSLATIGHSTIARCRAGSLGAAIGMFGGTLNVHDSNFTENRSTNAPQGAALGTAPAPGFSGIPDMDIDGLIHDCVFSNNTGSQTIWQGDRLSPPFNRLQYNANQIYTTTGDAPFYSQETGDLSIAQLNTTISPRSDGSQTIISPLHNNNAPTSAPAVGALLLLPPTVLLSGAPGEALPILPTLLYAASGGTPIVDGAAQRVNSGIFPGSSDAVHTLTVGSASFSTTGPKPAFAGNISTRLPVGTGQNVLIAGFIIQGNSPKRVLVRAIGPSLNGIIPGMLQDPKLELHSSGGAQIAGNDNWRSTQLGGVLTADQSIDIEATSIPPSHDAESAIVATLDPGSYTAVVGGANASTGIAVVEVYDLDSGLGGTLANISTRGFIQGGNDVMIGGFIYQGGAGATKVMVRGIGPSLGAFGISNPLADPILELHDGNGATVAANDDWGSSPDAVAIRSTAFAPSNAQESTIYQTALPVGAYTVVLQGKNGGTGIGLVEVYVF
jgi:predicted outer membrane repeat protein